MYKLEKSLSFLNVMVRVVFISTFIFTIAMGTVVYIKNWEQLAITLTERWFTVMVGELIVMGGIQIFKEVVQGKMRIEEIKAQEELNNDRI